MMNDILNAIKSHRIIKIGYRSKTGNSSVFIVHNINPVEVTDKYFTPRW